MHYCNFDPDPANNTEPGWIRIRNTVNINTSQAFTTEPSICNYMVL